MSYSCANDPSVPRVNYFSNPEVDYLDKATGTSTEDNAGTIKTNMVSLLQCSRILRLNDGRAEHYGFSMGETHGTINNVCLCLVASCYRPNVYQVCFIQFSEKLLDLSLLATRP